MTTRSRVKFPLLQTRRNTARSGPIPTHKVAVMCPSAPSHIHITAQLWWAGVWKITTPVNLRRREIDLSSSSPHDASFFHSWLFRCVIEIGQRLRWVRCPTMPQYFSSRVVIKGLYEWRKAGISSVLWLCPKLCYGHFTPFILFLLFFVSSFFSFFDAGDIQ